MSTKTKTKISITQLYGSFLAKTAIAFEKQYRSNIYVRDTLGFLGVNDSIIKTAIDARLSYDIGTDKQIIHRIAKANADAWFEHSLNDNVAVDFNNYEFGYNLGKAVAKLLITDLGRIVGIQPLISPLGIVHLLRYQDDINKTDGNSGMTLTVVTKAVEASTCKLRASLALETMQEAVTTQSAVVLENITNIIAQEVVFEYTNHILHEIVYTAGVMDNHTPSVTIACNHAANVIAKETRRGAGNIIIMPPSYVQQFIDSGNSDISLSAEHSTSHLEYAGTINNGTQLVFVSAAPIMQDKIVVLYKGGNGALDTGYIFTPYRVAMPGVAFASAEYTFMMSLFARYSSCQSKDISNYIKVIPTSLISSS